MLLPRGGELRIEAGLHWMAGDRYVELSLINASPTSLTVESSDVFRPFLKVNERRVGLSMTVAREILRRHFGKIAFYQEHRNRGVFSILIKVPSDPGH
jgi:K+-sensing histidine kinase KdpD